MIYSGPVNEIQVGMLQAEIREPRPVVRLLVQAYHLRIEVSTEAAVSAMFPSDALYLPSVHKILSKKQPLFSEQ